MVVFLLAIFASQSFERSSNPSIDRARATEPEGVSDLLQTPSQAEAEMKNRALPFVEGFEVPIEFLEFLQGHPFQLGLLRSLLPVSTP